MNWSFNFLGLTLDRLKGGGQCRDAIPDRSRFRQQARGFEWRCTEWELFIVNSDEMNHLFFPSVREEVGQLVLCDYDADLMHRLWSEQEMETYSPNMVEEIVVRSWLSSLSMRALNELLKLIFPSGSLAITPPSSSITVSSARNFVPLATVCPRDWRLFLSAFRKPTFTIALSAPTASIASNTRRFNVDSNWSDLAMSERRCSTDLRTLCTILFFSSRILRRFALILELRMLLLMLSASKPAFDRISFASLCAWAWDSSRICLAFSSACSTI